MIESGPKIDERRVIKKEISEYAPTKYKIISRKINCSFYVEPPFPVLAGHNYNASVNNKLHTETLQMNQ